MPMRKCCVFAWGVCYPTYLKMIIIIPKKKQSICKYFAPIKKEFTHVTDAKQHYSARSADPVYASPIVLSY
jgi:hypothetical protein